MVAGIVFSMDGSYTTPLKQKAKHSVFQSKIIPIEKSKKTAIKPVVTTLKSEKQIPAISKIKSAKKAAATLQDQAGGKQVIPKITTLKLKQATSITWDAVPQRIRSENNLEIKIAALKLKKATSVAFIK